MKNFLIAVTLLISNSLFAQTATQPLGSGTSSDPYIIATLENLYWISQNSSNWSSHFKQTADIDASATRNWGTSGFPPIGNASIKFTGKYNGQGYKISNLKITPSSGGVGLFGWISSSAELIGIGLENVNVSGWDDIGALVGRANSGGTISGCASSGKVTGSNRVGGLIGSMISGSISITKSYSAANCFGNSAIGGLVGQIESLSISTAISDCFSRGNVTRLASQTSTNVGSFVGNYKDNIANMAAIIRSYATGTVSYAGVTSPTDKGFIGAISGTSTTSQHQNNFFDSESSLQSSGNSATAKPTADMKNLVTFTNASWSTSTWARDDAKNSGYPHLINTFPVTLPVTWLSFNAEKLSNQVQLNWSTATEQNTKDFEVLHSTDANSWTKLGVVDAAGNSSEIQRYNFIHTAPLKNSIYNYYRIKQNDLDGKYSYSKIVSIIYNESGSELMVYPNPALDRLTVFISSDEEVRIVNLAGSTVWKGKLTAGRHEVTVAHLPRGVYLLQTDTSWRRILLQ